ncbi:hypothetical protein [Halomarina oriensis]|uniref:Uncharacterized protein n=1 Tax=Halomarina oriensis TaxID=671145 RepID=A0A6B0GNV5_9EURY|nr:hypothetical protein [Halomarina oriensis]MWG33815.1 hypothetical protein [Halomarina oriensis]
MTGMKEGAGEDPFAEDPESKAESHETEELGEREVGGSSTESKEGSRQEAGSRQSMRIPYKFRRDGVQDGRDRVPLFLHPKTKSAERDALHELEDRFDDSVSLTDLREALVMVGLDHLDEVELHLEEWGYGLTFD